MRIVFFIITLLLTLPNSLLAETHWITDPEPLAQTPYPKPSLVYFTAEWCPPCKLMKQTTLKDLKVHQAMGNVSTYMIDFDTHRDLAHRHQVSSIPSLLLINRFGEEVSRATGYREAPAMVEFLKQNESEWHSQQNKAEQEELAKLNYLKLLQGNPKEHHETLMLLMNELKQGKKDREDILFTFWDKDPESLLQILQHDVLFYRIIAHRYLIKYTDNETYDPWQPKEKRYLAIQQISKTLNQ